MAESVVTVAHNKPPRKLTKSEKRLAALLMVFGALLIVGTMAWLASSTDSGMLVSKETKTVEPVGGKAGEKTTEETDYADDVVLLAMTIGAVFFVSGAFFGKIREIKFGTSSVVLEAPEEETKKAEDKAAETAKLEAPEGKKDEAAELARQMAAQQVDLAYAIAPPSAKPVVAEAVGEAAGSAAVKAVAD